MKTKASKFISCCKYELGIFVLLCIQALMNLNEIKNMLLDFYSYYLVDFSMGKTSRLLIGSIVSLLTDKPTAAWIHGFAVVVLFLTLLATALIIGKVIKSASDEMRP